MKANIGFLAAICIAIVVLIPSTAFATDPKTETTQKVLEKMGQANDVGEFLAKWTTLGNALDKMPDKVKKAKGVFDKTEGPLNAAVNLKALFENIKAYRGASDQQKGKIGADVAKSFYDLLIKPVVDLTPQGALVNLSVNTGLMCYNSMINAVTEYQLSQAQAGLYAGNAVGPGGDGDYIDQDSKWYNFACQLFVGIAGKGSVGTKEIYKKVSELEKIDPYGKYSKLAVACYKNGATLEQIFNFISAQIDLDNFNATKAKELREATERQKYLAQLAAEEKKKQEDAQKVALLVKLLTAAAKAKNQETIQTYCKFSNVSDVWKAIDTHKFANSLYQVWANSYPKPLLASRPKNLTDKQIIQERCKFGNQNDVWKAVEKHKNANDLLKAWADSYYQGLRK